MAEPITIEIKGLDKLKEKMKDLSDVTVRQQMERTMYRSTEMIKNRARDLVRVDTGALRRSIRDIVQVGEREIKGIVGPTEPYGAPVEFGARPHFPPVGALERWARKRGINPWALAVSISRKGTESHPFLIPAFEQFKNKIIEEFRNAIDYLIKK
jgi:HK97 gp10 family phage protein